MLCGVRFSTQSRLRAAPVLAVQMGYSLCRFCRCTNGSAALRDGAWIWPEGLAHYVDVHDVVLPAEFVKHAVAAPHKYKVPTLTAEAEEQLFSSIDSDYWVNWAREYSMQGHNT